MALQAIETLSTQEIAKLPTQQLCNLQQAILEQFEQAKRLKERFQDALQLKYQAQVTAQRLADAKQTGVVHLNDGDIQIDHDLPTRVSWNQKQLAIIAKRIADSGEDPTEYLDIHYKVPERKYNAWPASIKDAFTQARTVKAGAPVIKLHQDKK